MIVSLHLRLLLPAMLLCLASCKIHSDHVVETRHEIKPIEINVNVRVERELDNFFEDLDEASATVDAAVDSESETTSESPS